MTPGALSLVLAAALIHATWNLLNKRASGHGTFTWLVAVLSALLYAPVAAFTIFYWKTPVDLPAVGFMAGSALLHTAYFLLLNAGYRAGDLSLVYPLARGTGPLLSSIAAILFLGERPSVLAVGGGLLVVAGIIALTADIGRLRQAGPRRAASFALLTGTFIAGYTLWDKQAVSVFAVAPIVLDWGANLGRALLLTPYALRHWRSAAGEWRRHRFEAVGMAILAPFSYILVLTAMRFTPVSYVAPAREVSILIGTVMGTRLLAEGDAGRRLTGAAAMVVGITALAIG